MLLGVAHHSKKLFIAAGAVFFAIGFVTLLGSANDYKISGSIPWLFLSYAFMDMLLGLGFWRAERWLLYCLGLNAAGYITLDVLSFLLGSKVSMLPLTVNILLSAGIWALLYKARHTLTENPWSRLEAAVFLFLWLGTFCWSAINLFF
jgi:hypothetical protein